MKPQALQDAIKAAALKKRTKVESKGWKEPVVKKHQISAEEFAQAKSRRPQAPPAATAASPYSSLQQGGGGAGAAGADVLRKIEQQRREFQEEKDAIIAEMRSHRREMVDYKSCLSEVKKEVEDLKKLVWDLRAENKALRDKMGGGSSSAGADDDRYHLKPHTAEKLQKYQGRAKSAVCSMVSGFRFSRCDSQQMLAVSFLPSCHRPKTLCMNRSRSPR